MIFAVWLSGVEQLGVPSMARVMPVGADSNLTHPADRILTRG